MSSKIGGIDSSTSTAALGAGRAVQRPQDAATGANSNSVTSDGAENVQVSGAARQLASLEQAVNASPVVNQAKVTQISNSIADGTYSVNARHIADQLIQSDKALAQLQDGGEADSNAEAD